MVLDLVSVVILSTLAGLTGGLIAGYLTTRRMLRGGYKIPVVELPRGKHGRGGRRYVVFEVLGTEPISFDELREIVESTARRVYGEITASMMGVKLVEYDEVKRRGVVRVRRDYKYHALAILGMIRSVGSKKVMIVPLATTGSLKRAKRLVES